MQRRFSGLLLTAAVIAVYAGALASVGLLLYASARVGAPSLLRVLFAMWIVAPFVGLAAGLALSGRLSVLSRATLVGVTLVVTVASVAMYAVAALGQSRPPTAVFVLVPPATWLLAALVVAIAALVSRQSARGTSS